MSVAGFSIENRVFVNLLFILGGVAGILAFTSNQVDVYPNVSFDAGQILVVWPGASPAEVEASVTRKVEEEILDVPGADRVVSYSERDRSLIDVKFRENLSDAEFDASFNELRARVQRVSDLPLEAEAPQLRKISVNELYPLLQVVVTSKEGKTPLRVLREVARELREALRRVDGVMRVSDLGIPEKEWKVLVRRADLDSANLTLLEIAQRLQERHKNLPSGTLQTGKGEYAITATGEFTTLASLRDLVVGYQSDSSPVHLRDVADVTASFERPRKINRHDGRRCINLSVAKDEGADAVELRERIQDAIDGFEASVQLPPEIEITSSVDTTRIIKNRIRILVDNLAFGIALVFLVLWTFLGARNSLLAVVGIPFSFLVSLIVLNHYGITINAITLFSFMLVSGMVVDDAIVVLENIYRRVQKGEALKDAVVRGTTQVFWPVVSSTLTTLAAFLPMLLMEGVVGEFMSIIPKTVAAVLAASLIECLIILPTHYLHLGTRLAAPEKKRRVDKLLDRMSRVYGAVLRRVVRRPIWVVVIVLVVTTGVARVGSTLPVELFPSDFQAFYCNITCDPEYSLDTTSTAVREIERRVEALIPTKVESYTTSIGATFTADNQLILKPNVAQVLVYMSEDWTADHDSDDLVREVRGIMEALVADGGDFRFTDIQVDAFKDGPPVGKPVAVRVRSDDYGVGKAVARDVKAYLRRLPGVTTITDNLEEGPREVQIRPDPERSARAGVPFDAVARTVLIANEGLEVGDLLPEASDDEVTLRLQLTEADRRRPRDLLLLGVRNREGRLVQLDEVTDVEVSRGPASLYHYDGNRTVLVTADLDKDQTDSGTVNEALIERFRGIERSYPGVTLEFGGEFEETQKSFESLKRAFVIAILLIFTILAVQFRSYRLPFVVIVVVPFSFVGVVLGLWVMGFPFTILAFIAIVGLSGVVVNDSLVLVDFIRTRHEKSGALEESVIEGSLTRMRAVLLTTITTVIGLLPMAVGLTGHSKVWSPFAATITFGLSLAMLLTLFLVPATYVLVHRGLRRERS